MSGTLSPRSAGIATFALVSAVGAALTFVERSTSAEGVSAANAPTTMGTKRFRAAVGSPGATATQQVPAEARAFRFEGEEGTPTRYIMNAFSVLIAAGCDSEGRLKVKMRLLNPGQLHSASVDTVDTNEDAINEVRGVFRRQPHPVAVNILSSRTNNQIGHTEVITGTGNVVSLHWQADNPSSRFDLLQGGEAQHQCLFAGTAVAVGGG